MKELSKSIIRRLHEPNFISRYFVGDGIDIGGFPDPFSLYAELFPLVSNIDVWDLEDGDAQYMKTLQDNTFDFVLSSHCLEHLQDPFVGIANWFRILKPGGHLIVTVPEEDLYEQGVWPSNMNRDHKHTFTVSKTSSWSPASINILQLLQSLGALADVRKISVEDSTYRYRFPRFDQTLTPTTESAIEFVVRKRTQAEIDEGSSKRMKNSPASPEHLLPYLNQYLDDQKALRSFSQKKAPFKNQSRL